ncbi:YveK family protein [Loigolactobacillus backii]|uniref:YveK family protein n=1 Tax=Loigolactobacillus backii TaxID=375175 RepID=UPI0007F1390F|nr:hypothetical protein [Loigolactobacillus backii]ANK59138.1 hypothetical protein AYR52_01965 [Loigolactobacillus backii]ANK64127.1 hypothetical protein AYR54_01955 [Loigolactobacillus backii]ANK67479.1 hypothetical protein AYR55_07085 [Loigolactobacillus backii]MDA5387331.1 hypothetical protein [Loigolactobacillus backii]MDA5389870.1 hypothetical protein [Loigolactobacillus backii]
MEESITLKSLVMSVLKRWYVVILAMLVFAAGGYWWSGHTYQSAYSATASFMVEPTHHTAKRIEAVTKTVPTYQDLLGNSYVLNGVQKKMNKVAGYNKSVDFLQQHVHSQANMGSMIIKVTVDGDTAKLATKTTNTLVDVFQSRLHKFTKKAKVRHLAPATVSEATLINKRSTKKYTFYGLLLGLIIGLCLALVFDRVAKQRSKR